MTRSHRLLPLAALALGLATLGCGGTLTTSGEVALTPAAAPPKAEVRGDTSISAGEADYARPRDFTFTVTNTGGSPLELTLARKSCSCADVQVPGPIAPHGEGRVVIHWTPIPGSAGAYTLFADVQTNEPAKRTLHLVVNAHVLPLVRVFIEGKEKASFVDFGDNPLTPGEKRTREVKVFSTKLPAFDLNAACSVPGFDVSRATPLPRGTRVGDYGITSGYSLEISTTKDLPFGYVRAQLNLALSNLGDGEPDRTIAVPVYAMVGQGLFTVSPAVLLFNMPNIGEGGTARVNLTFITPPTREEVTVQAVEPSCVRVDRPEKAANGQWRVTAHIPKDDPEAARYQADGSLYGQVTLQVAGLDHPVTIEVKWAPLPAPR